MEMVGFVPDQGFVKLEPMCRVLMERMVDRR